MNGQYGSRSSRPTKDGSGHAARARCCAPIGKGQPFRMGSRRHLFWLALAFASWIGAAYADVTQAPGAQIYERRCRTCHGGAALADLPIGPDLRGIIGRKAGTGKSGVYSRELIDSGVVWDRDSLRRFLTSPSATVSDSHASFGKSHADEVESLLDYLESLRDPDRKPAVP